MSRDSYHTTPACCQHLAARFSDLCDGVEGVEYRALVMSSRARSRSEGSPDGSAARLCCEHEQGVAWRLSLGGLTRPTPLLGVSCSSTICARMSMDSAKYVAFS